MTVPPADWFSYTGCYAWHIEADPCDGCYFVEWTCTTFGGDPDCHIANPYSADTYIDLTYCNQDSLTAHFTCGAGATPTPTMTATPTQSTTPTATPTSTPPPGDANGDLLIDAGDITALERIILDGPPFPPGADANGDGDVNAADIGVIEYMILEIWPWDHVHIEAPASLPNGADFTATVFVTYVEGFGSAGFEVGYDPDVLDLQGVSGGKLLEIDPGVSAEFHTVDIDDWSLHGGPGAVRINASVSGNPGPDGAGYLARLHFQVTGSAGQGSAIGFNTSQSWLRDSLGGAIDATWADDWFTVAP